MNIESLSIEQMRAALAVAELGSFSGAARRFRRAQSAVSYAVATLERQLGVSLFERIDGGKPEPTETGRLLLNEMEAVVRRADDIKKQARSIGRGLESHITITVDSLFPLASLAEVLKSFESNFPTVQIRLNVEAMGAVQEDVIEGRSTLGIIGSFLNLPAGLIGDGLFRVVRFPVAANEHPLAQGTPRKRIPHRMLLDHIQIVQSDRSKLTIGRDFTVYTGRTWRVSDLGAKRDLLRAGLGWGYMPDHSISDEIKAGVLRRIWVEDIRDRNTVAQVLVRRRDRLMGPGARWLIDRLTG